MTPDDPAPVVGVVLAGGASRRMGRDKATLRLPDSDRTLVEQLVDVLSRRCRPVFVVAAAGQVLPELPARVLRDEIPDLGPLPATARGLRAAAEAGAALAFVSAVDLPYLSVDLIDALTGVAARLDADVVLPWDGRDHYLAAVYRTRLAGRIEDLVAAGERSMRALVDGVDAQRVVLRAARELTNVNSPDQLPG